MLFGITGAHRSGKTTLAAKVSEEISIEFLQTSITKAAKKMNIDPVAPMSLATRVHLQRGLLEMHVDDLAKAPRPLITDRTPIDQIGYLLGEFSMNSDMLCNESVMMDAHQLVFDCLDVTKSHYEMVFKLGPLPTYEVDPTKPAPNLAYQQHMDMLMSGALMSLYGSVDYIVFRETDLNDRRDYFCDTILQRLEDISEQRKVAQLH